MNNTEKSEAVRQNSVKSKPESKIWKFLKLPHKKTVCFIGKITVKIDSRGIYSLENINYHDAYLNISIIATCQPSFVDRSGAPNVANHLHMFGRPSGGATIHRPRALPHPSQHPGPDAPRSGPFSSFQFRSSGRSQQ